MRSGEPSAKAYQKAISLVPALSDKLLSDSAVSGARKRPQFFVKLRLQGRCSVLVPDPLVASKCADAV